MYTIAHKKDTNKQTKEIRPLSVKSFYLNLYFVDISNGGSIEYANSNPARLFFEIKNPLGHQLAV